MMPLQRACDAEMQVRNKLSNGPRRAQSNGISPGVFCDVWADVICRGYVCILLSARETREFEVAPRILQVFVLDRKLFC